MLGALHVSWIVAESAAPEDLRIARGRVVGFTPDVFAIVASAKGELSCMELAKLTVEPPAGDEAPGLTAAEQRVLCVLIESWAAQRARLLPGDNLQLRRDTIRHLFAPPLGDSDLAAFLARVGNPDLESVP